MSEIWRKIDAFGAPLYGPETSPLWKFSIDEHSFSEILTSIWAGFSLDLGPCFFTLIMHPLKVSFDRERFPSDRYRCGPGLNLQCSIMLLKEVLLGVWQCNVKIQSKGRKKQPSLYNPPTPPLSACQIHACYSKYHKYTQIPILRNSAAA